MSTIHDENLILGPLKLNLASRKIFIENQYIFLRNKEFSLLLYFMRNIGRVLTRTQILEDVWDRNIICPTNTVDVHISSLRRKLSLLDFKKMIKTVHCIGYICEP